MKLLFLFISMFLGTLAPQDKLDQARTLIYEGKVLEAKTVCEQVLQEDPLTPGGKEMLEDINLWLATRKAGTSKAVYQYLLQTKAHLFEAEALASLTDLEDREAWQEVSKSEKASDYKLFLAGHPDSKYITDARNRLAQVLADNFRRKSTAEERDQALEYAMDEPTREYVEYAYAAATRTLDPAKTWRTDPQPLYEANKERKKIKFAVGAVAAGYVGHYQGRVNYIDYYHPVTNFLTGAGVALRLGEYSQAVNTVFSTYAMIDYLALPKTHYQNFSGAFCFDENWNFYRGKRMSVFLNGGLVIEYPWVLEARAGVGTAWKHGEWKVDVLLARSRMETLKVFHPFFGMSYTYFF